MAVTLFLLRWVSSVYNITPVTPCVQSESYSFMKPEAGLEDVAALGLPVKDRVCFAGVD